MNKLIYLLVIAAGMIVSCSDLFDSSTSLGDDILRDKNPKITNPDEVLVVDSATVPVVKAGSIQRAIFKDSTREEPAGVFTTELRSGKSGLHSVWAYVGFTEAVELEEGFLSLNRAQLTIEASSMFSSQQTTTGDTLNRTFAVYALSTKKDLSLPFDSIVTDTTGSLVSTVMFTAVRESEGELKLLDSIATLQFTGEVDEVLKVDGVDSTRSVQPSHHILLIPAFGSDETATVQFEDPEIDLDYAFEDTIRTVTQSSSVSQWGVIEQEENLDERPVSVWAAERYTVTTLDLRPFWDSVLVSDDGDTAEGILAAEIDLAIDSSQFGFTDSFLVRYQIRSTELGSSDTLKLVGTSELRFAAGATPEFTIDIGRSLERLMIDQQLPGQAFLYLHAVSKRSTLGSVTWDLSEGMELKINAVLSNPR